MQIDQDHRTSQQLDADEQIARDAWLVIVTESNRREISPELMRLSHDAWRAWGAIQRRRRSRGGR